MDPQTPKNPPKSDIAWLLRDKYGSKMTPAAKKDIVRLERGEHVSYVIGWTPFLGCRVDLSARPLIPRPETEHWTEIAIRRILSSGKREPLVLDICCGSGCIGLAALKRVPKSKVDFADIESKYFQGIRKSLRQNKISLKRARFSRSDLFKNVRQKRYDFILANPPYIPSSGRFVAASVIAQEPKRALYGGRDGLLYIRKLLREAGSHLTPGGFLAIEFDPPQRSDIARIAASCGWRSEFQKDQYGRWRSVFLTRIKKGPTKGRPD